MKNSKGTPLWNALLFEHRLPWRYIEPFRRIKKKMILLLGMNTNTKNYWNKEFKKMGMYWRTEPYELIMEFLPKNKYFSLLDLGCALGDGCEFLKKQFPKARIEGCDFSEVAIKKAKKKIKNINFFVLDIRKNEIPKKYDYLTLISILEHIRKPEKTIEKCLKCANTLIINCPYNEKKLHVEHLFKCKKNTFKEFNPEVRVKDKRITYIIKK